MSSEEYEKAAWFWALADAVLCAEQPRFSVLVCPSVAQLSLEGRCPSFLKRQSMQACFAAERAHELRGTQKHLLFGVWRRVDTVTQAASPSEGMQVLM